MESRSLVTVYNNRFAPWKCVIFLKTSREISGTITKVMTLQFSPNYDWKCLELAKKSDFSQLRLEQTQKHLSPTDMFWMFFSDSRAILNIPWPWEHLLSLSQFQSKVMFKCAELHVSDNFISKEPKELLWRCKSSMKSPLSHAILNQTKDFFESLLINSRALVSLRPRQPLFYSYPYYYSLSLYSSLQ